MHNIFRNYAQYARPRTASMPLTDVSAAGLFGRPNSMPRPALRRIAPRCAAIITAAAGEGLPELLAAISSKLQESLVEMDVLLPYAAGDLVEEAHRCGSVKATEFTEEGTRLRVVVPPQLAGRLRRHMVAGTAAGVVGTAGSRQQQDDAAAVVAPA